MSDPAGSEMLMCGLAVEHANKSELFPVFYVFLLLFVS